MKPWTSASAGSEARPRMAMVPMAFHTEPVPMAEARQAATIASWARPCWVMGWPSKAVAIADGVPGVFTSTAGMASENIAQT